jgi:hypothetical protein
MDHTTGKQMTVPDREMQNFIKVSDSYDDGLIFMDAANCTIPDLKDKDRVRVTEGPFRGGRGSGGHHKEGPAGPGRSTGQLCGGDVVHPSEPAREDLKNSHLFLKTTYEGTIAR